MNEFSKLVKTSGTDEWYTAEKDVEIIVPYLKRGGYKKILCPFDKKDSAFVKVLSKNGFDVNSSHIEEGTDFFDIDNLCEYDAVVSNPPFSKRDKVFEKLFESEVPFAMIMNFNGLFDSKKRWQLFKENDFEMLVPKGRMKFFNSGIDGETSSPPFQSIYVCRGIGEKQIEFMEKR